MKKYFLTALFVSCLFITAAIPELRAEDNSEDEEEFSPWAAWRKGHAYSEKGERLQEKGENSNALEAYRKAYQYFDSVKKARPNWNQQVINGRIRICEREINKLMKKVGTPPPRTNAAALERTRETSAELQNVKAELVNYKKKLFAALIELNDLKQRVKRQKSNTEQIEDLMREKRILGEEYKLLQEKYSNLQEQQNKPGVNEKRLKAQLVDIKIKNDILSQRLKLQEDKEKELNDEMATLYRYKTETKNSIKEFKKLVDNLNYKVKKANELQKIEAEKTQDALNKLESAATQSKQLAANLEEKNKEITKLNEWLKQLREKSGNQNELQQEIIKANQLVTKKYNELKKENEKNIREMQQLNSMVRQNNIAEVELKKTLQELNTQRGTVDKEYQLLRKSYDQLLLIQKDSNKEIKMLQNKVAKAEDLVKNYSEKYEWTKKKLETRENSDLQNISSLNQQIRELNKKLDKKNVAHKNLKVKFDGIESKYGELQKNYTTLKKLNSEIKADKQLLAKETESSQALKKENDKLRKENELLAANHAQALAKKRKEYQEKLKESEKRLIALQKQNQDMAENNNKLTLASTQISQLREKLQDANKTIQILRNVSAGKTAAAHKSSPAATKYTEQVATAQPTDPKKLLADGIKAENEDAEEVAIWNYRKFLTAKPDNAEVNRRLGNILYRRGQIAEAAGLLRKAYALAPDDTITASVYSQILIKEKKFADAAAILKKALNKNPKNYELLTTYANAQAGAGKTTAALDNLEAAIKLSPDNPQAYLTRAQIIAIYHPDLMDAAAESYRKARKLGAKPDVFLEDALPKKQADNSEMVLFLQKPASEAAQNKDWASASWYFGQLHKLMPENTEYREKLAMALLLQDKYGKSLTTLGSGKLSNNGMLIAAGAELCQGNYSKAAEYLKKAKKADSMKAYFEALKGYLKAVSSKAKQKQQFQQACTTLNKLL
ncbi:MAG: tetratricopeptide repeat protein [Victivallales bacterium]